LKLDFGKSVPELSEITYEGHSFSNRDCLNARQQGIGSFDSKLTEINSVDIPYFSWKMHTSWTMRCDAEVYETLETGLMVFLTLILTPTRPYIKVIRFDLDLIIDPVLLCRFSNESSGRNFFLIIDKRY
jgi:hypothetical protein